MEIIGQVGFYVFSWPNLDRPSLYFSPSSTPIFFLVQTIWICPNHFTKTFASVTNDRIAKIQWSFFSFHFSVFLASFDTVDPLFLLISSPFAFKV